MTTPGRASRDLSGPTGLTTEQFVMAVRARLDGKSHPYCEPVVVEAPIKLEVDEQKLKNLFHDIEAHKNVMDYSYLTDALLKYLGVKKRN